MSTLTRVVRAACLLICLIALRALAPTTSGVAAQQPQRSDSAGVSFLTYTPSQLSTLPVRRANPVPLLSIGEADGPPGLALNNVWLVTSHRDGGVVIADDRGTVLRRYDSSGRYVGSFGSAGNGPGEFRRIDGISWLPGDSLAAYDRVASRVTVVGPDLRLGRTAPLPGPIRLDGGFNSVGAMHIYGLGTINAIALAHQRENTPRGSASEPVIVRENARLVLLAPDSPSPSGNLTIGLVPGSTQQYSGTSSSNVQFASDPFLGGNHTGFFYADGARFQVRRYDPAGRLQWVADFPGTRRPVTASERDRVTTSLAAQPRPANLPPRPPVAFADAHPLITSAFLDANGNVWLRPDEAIAEGRGWLVVSPTGQALAWHSDVSQELGADLRYIGSDHVLAVTRDALGIERVIKLPTAR